MRLVPCHALMPTANFMPLSKFRSKFVLLANEEDYVGLGELVVTVLDEPLHWLMQSGDVLPLAAVTHWSLLTKPLVSHGKVNEQELRDDDGYPSAYAHQLLKQWPFEDPMGWFHLAQKLWHFQHYFEITESAEKWALRVGTAGWSGNEGLLAAMKQNMPLWSDAWRSSRRGGHYEFEVTKES